jgi:hypothetical protein
VKNWQWGLVAAGVLFSPIPLTYLGVFNSVATAPGRVVNRAMRTDNIVTSYEWFYETNGQFKARAAQVKTTKALIDGQNDGAGEPDEDELARLRVELAGQQQSCRELAEGYNARSEEVNHAIFKGRDAPETLDSSLCE